MVVAPARIDPVIAHSAVEAIVGAAAGQGVGVGAAHHALEAADRVPLGVAPAHGARCEVDGDRRRTAEVVEPVDTRASVEGIGARSAADAVLPASSREVVVAFASVEVVLRVRTGDRVVVGRAGSALDPHEGVARRVAAREGASREIQMNRGIGIPVDGMVELRGAASREGVGPGAAVESVTAQAAEERVLPRTALEIVAAAPAVETIVAAAGVHGTAGVTETQGVAIVGPLDPLEAGDRIPLGIAARGLVGQEVHGDPGRGTVVVEHVDALPADEGVGPGTTAKDGGTRAAADEGVLTPATLEAVVAALALDPVVAVVAVQDVAVTVPGEGVGMWRTIHLLETGNRIAGGMPSAPRTGGEVDGDPRIRALVIEDVPTPSAGQRITPRLAREPVVEAVSGQGVGSGGPHDTFEAGNGVPRGVPSAHRAGGEVDRDPRVRARVIEHVVARAAGQPVGIRPAPDPVVVGIPGEGVLAGSAVDPVNARKGVPLRISARARALPEVHRDRKGRRGVRDDVEARTPAEQIRARPPDQQVVPAPAVERVRPRSPVEPIRPLAAVEYVGATVADERVGVGGTREVFEPREGVPGRVATARRAGGEVDRDAGL